MDFTLTRFLSLIVMRCSFLDSIYPSFLPPSLSSSINRMRELLSNLETVSTQFPREFPDRWIVNAKLVAFAADQILCKIQYLFLGKDAAMASSTSGKKKKLQETGSSSFSWFATEGFYTSFPSSSEIDDEINWIIWISEELLVSGEIKIGYSGVLAYINPGLSEQEVGELLYSSNPSQLWSEKYKKLIKQSVLIDGPESVNSFFNPIYNHQPIQASLFTLITSLHLSGLSDFVELPGLPVLHTLKISGCERLNAVSICEKLSAVEALEISCCPELISLAGLNQLLSLRSLSLSFCFNLQFDLDVQLPPLLEYLDLTHCSSLEEWCQNAGLQNWKLDETIESFQRSSPVGDSPVYGRENEKNSIIEFLLSDDLNRNNLTVVCIVGESGIGKTSMVHLIYNEERVLDSFDARIFITMPDKSNETTLIKKLIESVMGFPCPMTEADLLEELLVDELSDTKVFVVLDDAENENPCFLNRIVTILNHSSRGSVLLVSTKSRDVAEVIGAMQTYYLDPLSDYYCWKIFCQHIFTGLSTNANTDVVETGKQLVSKCQRNPLCIKVLAGLLVCSKNEESLVEILKTDRGDIFGFDGDTLPILRVGYELLPDNLKKCLHYCSLFPKDYVFAKQQIVRMWMSQGFIIPVEGRQPEEVGLHNFDELLLRGFFQHSPLHDVEEDKYIMHDLIRAMATHFSRNECSPAEDAVEMILENCFHFSLNPSKIQIDKMKPLIKEASDLQSFLALSRLQTRINISILDITSLSDLFTKCINLRTLDLSCTDIVELPSSVVMLKQLRYLGVSNTKIKSIPRALCSLVSLQTLEAKDCQQLVELPDSMMELTNLCHLDVSKKSGCVKMMIGIGQLTNLQSLAVFSVGCEMPYCSIRELKDLNRLSGCLQIAGLENITNGLDAKEAALHNKVHLNTLCLHWKDNRTCTDSEESITISEVVFSNLKPNPQIGELIIRNYIGNLFPTWMGDSSFSKLVSVILDKCPNCSQFPALGGLPSLRHLSVQKLYHLERLEIADNQFGSKNTPKFPSLETLNLWEMYDLEELFETSDQDFPCLRTLSINRCPMLKRIPCFSSLLSLSLICCVKLPDIPDLASLKSLKIDGFPKLKSLELPKYLPVLKKLEIRHCNELLLVEGLPELSLEKLNVVHCPKFDSPKGWKLCHPEPISTTRWFFPKEESTTQMEHEETSESSGEDTDGEQPKVDKSDFFLKRLFFPKEESTTQMEDEETFELSGEDTDDEQPKVDKSDFFRKRILQHTVTTQTKSEVDILDDGFRWHKYKQKSVKGSLHPKSYYSCTHAGCSVKKCIGRSSEDSTIVITRYYGVHNHQANAGSTSSKFQDIGNLDCPSTEKEIDMPSEAMVVPVTYSAGTELEHSGTKLTRKRLYDTEEEEIAPVTYSGGTELEHSGTKPTQKRLYDTEEEEAVADIREVQSSSTQKKEKMKLSDNRAVWGMLLERLHGLPVAIAAEVRSFRSVQDNWSSLMKAKETLQAVQTVVNIKVARVIEKSRSVHPLVMLWLSRVEEIIEDKTLEEEYEKLMISRFNLSRRRKLGKRIVKKHQYVKSLIEEEKQFADYTDVCVDPPVDVVDRVPVAKMFGMDTMLKQLNEYFEDHERCIIGVWGAGGVGKTTLLSVFNNELMGCSDFHAVILIDVSNSGILNVKDIQRTIVDRLGLPWVDTETEDARAKLLMKALSRKRFVILLDDVRKKFQLENIGIPLPNTDNRSKIILASREQDVCIQMGAQRNLIKMQLLDDRASWDLFFSNLSTDAQRSIKSSYSIKKRAEVITKCCQGLPLALNTISCTLAGLKSANDWRDAMKAISMGLGEIGGVAEQIFKLLKYSYDKLDSTTKKCFLYCTLCPENSSIKKEQLVEYWIAEGFIPENQSWRGSVMIINKLISVCLLQETNSGLKVRLLNTIHHFGHWLAKQENNFLVQSGKNLERAPEIEQWIGPKRISLMSNDIKEISFSPNCSNLETLLLQNNQNLKSLSPKFFKSMINLKVLDLSNTGIKELPECDTLCQLQYLNLSQTPITKLPRRFWVLKELRYLDLSLTEALEETYNNCSKLLKLRVLNLFRSHYGIRDVSDLNLDRLEGLNFLGITISTEDVLKKLKKTDPLVKLTHRLSLTDCPRMKSIDGTDFNQMVNLQELYIESCPNLRELVMDQDDGGVSNLQVLTLWKLRNLHTILNKSLRHYFRSIRELTIYECHRLENINWVVRLESLEKLVVSRCKGMVHIITELAKGAGAHGMQIRRDRMSEEKEIQTLVEEVSKIRISEKKKKTDEEIAENIEFPKLRSVILSDMENMVSICSPRSFLSLESIIVQKCPNLARLPVSNDHKIIKLRQLRGSSEWWSRLEWDGIETRRNLEKYFIAI